VQRSVPGIPATTAPRSAYPGSTYSGAASPSSTYQNPGYSRSISPGNTTSGNATSGHLGAWLNEHRTQPVQEQERILRSDPSFKRLNPAVQQRLVQQLHQVNQLPEQQQQRRLARANALEHMSSQDRTSVNLSARRWAALAPERQALMRNAFRDLRKVPTDQRQTVLYSNRYQGAFSPDERGILTDLLRAEPYEPVR
jgi:phage-related protein